MAMKLGFIGLGMMGLPMLEKLASGSGMEILAYDHAEAPFRQLALHPAWGRSLLAASSLDDLASCEVVITMLPNSKITNAVIAGAHGLRGLADVLAPGAVVIDMGSSNPADTLALARQLEPAGLTLIDAPVSGAVAKARTGSLAIMVGGSDAALRLVRPVLDWMGSTIICTGEVGSAHAIKALNNYVYAAGLLAASEALLIAKSMGLDLDIFSDVLNASSGRNVATETKLRQFIIPRNFNAGFALRLQAKDLATANGLQALACVDAPQLTLCNALWNDAMEVLDEDADNTAIYHFLEQRQRQKVS